MTELEYLEQKAVLEQEMRELKAANSVQMDLIYQRHRDNIQAENDRYCIEQRRQKAEFAEKRGNLILRLNDVQRQRAVTRAKEQTALQEMLNNATETSSVSNLTEQPQQ